VELNGAQILVRTLMEEGVDTIFGYPGGSVLDIYDQLFQSPIRHILARHEQGVTHAADGYARASGKTGVCIVTSGPGATNTITGITTAFMDSIPMVILTGQVPTQFIGTDAFQEADIIGITRPCTKHNFLVRRVDELARTIREAFYIASSGRPGPVLVDLPKDVMQARMEYQDVPAKRQARKEPVFLPDTADLEQTVAMLKEAKNPVILVGGGVLRGRASEELREFVRKVKMPVASTLMGLGSFPADDPLWLGMVGMHGMYYANMAVSNCDLLVTLGVRFSDRVTGKLSTFAPRAKIIQVDVDATSINKNVLVHLPIVSDCKSALVQLNTMLGNNGLEDLRESRRHWLDQIEKWRVEGALTYTRGELIKPQMVIETLNRLTGGNAIIATEVGQNQMWTAQFYRFNEPNTFLTSGGLGTMGYGFPAAIGAQVAFPDRLVVDIAGDGSIQMNIQELATAVKHNLPVKIVILNNGYLGMVRQWQELFYEKRYSHTNISGQVPDFVKLAEAYGALGLRTADPDEVESVLKKGIEASGPVIMDFLVEPEEKVYPMVNPGAALTEMQLGRETGL
jgi:acetolactate synthase I/II/III large subunit